MTEFDFDMTAEEPSAGPLLLKRALIAIIGGIALIFIAGMIAGYVSVAFRNGLPGFIGFVILGAMLLAVVATAYGMWRLWPRGLDGPVAPRVRSARIMFFASIAVSLLLGIILGVADVGNTDLLSNTPVSSDLALIAIGLWGVAGPILTWLWWKRVDEHEADAYRQGATLAAHFYMYVTPAWWMATRAGWLPPQEPMIVLLVVSIVWMLVWFIRRYF